MEHANRWYYLLMAIIVCAGPAFSDSLPVFPGAQGFGCYTPAGRGGKIIKVTNLNDDGPGSLREAVEQSGPRIVVFEVGGIITQNSYLRIRDPYITIAGQTAPSPGITLTGRQGIWVYTHDVLIRHIAVRLSDSRSPWIGPNDTEQRISLSIHNRGGNPYNLVFDHCSFMWHNGKVQVWGDCKEETHNDFTFTNCIISEGLLNSLHYEGAHSKGMLIGNILRRISVIRCLFSHNGDRNPLIKGGSRGVVVNSAVYNPMISGIVGTWTTFCDGGARSVRMVAIGNVLKSGVNTALIGNSFVNYPGGGSSVVYYEDNVADRNYQDDNGDPSQMAATPQEALWHESIKVFPSSKTWDCVLSNVGPRPLDRDTVERRVISDVINGTGRIIDSPSEVGGLPDHQMVTRTLDIPANPDADDDNDGYTNVEEWLNRMADELEAPSSCEGAELHIHGKKVEPQFDVPGIRILETPEGFELQLPFDRACRVAIYRPDGRCICRIRRERSKPIRITDNLLQTGLNILTFDKSENRAIRILK
ncbi:MAG: right-handed parallel beta-helix repeat-containing protein [Chitinivibrionales bacterium]|nr:right-handed parallel beta-helix repeat-containing protein [Chitinivibrionales bacterium]